MPKPKPVLTHSTISNLKKFPTVPTFKLVRFQQTRQIQILPAHFPIWNNLYHR